MSEYDPWAADYDAWAAAMTEDVAHYVSLAREAEGPIRGKVPADSALARLDRDVNAMLEKRRWLLEHGKLAAAR